MRKTESTQTHSTRRAAATPRHSRRAAAPQITVESARALVARIARLREQAEQLQTDLEALRDELPEGEIGPIDNRNYLAEVRQKVQSCLTDLEGPVSLLQPDEDDAECVLRSLEQLARSERCTARASSVAAPAFTDRDKGAPISGMPAPLPCPFCGHEHVEIYDEDGMSVACCAHCGAEGGYTERGPAEAARWWNTRAPAHDLPPRADLAQHLEEQNRALLNASAVVAIAQGQITAAQNEREDASVGEDAAVLIRQSLGLVQTALEGVAEQLEPVVALDRVREDAVCRVQHLIRPTAAGVEMLA